MENIHCQRIHSQANRCSIHRRQWHIYAVYTCWAESLCQVLQKKPALCISLNVYTYIIYCISFELFIKNIPHRYKMLGQLFRNLYYEILYPTKSLRLILKAQQNRAQQDNTGVLSDIEIAPHWSTLHHIVVQYYWVAIWSITVAIWSIRPN